MHRKTNLDNILKQCLAYIRGSVFVGHFFVVVKLDSIFITLEQQCVATWFQTAFCNKVSIPLLGIHCPPNPADGGQTHWNIFKDHIARWYIEHTVQGGDKKERREIGQY